jgi:hypothetical protein
MLRGSSNQVGGGLARLEKRLDRVDVRLSGRLATAWSARRAGRPPRAAEKVDLASALTRDDADVAELAEALRYTLKHGAFESAAALTSRLETSRTANRLDVSGVASWMSASIMLGKLDAARALAQAHAATLRASVEGVTLLSLLGLEDPAGVTWLPNGSPNCVGLNRRILAGTLDPEQLAQLLGTRLGLWVAEPELNLLFFNALRGHDSVRACAFLSRFLRAHGLPSCHELRSRDSVAFTFDTPRAVEGGPLVSVVLAAHDSEDTIALAVDSLLGQSYRNLEILVGDDASRDDTLRLLKARYGAEPRVRLFSSRANQGAYNLRNALLARARGAILTCHDADDIALPTRIALQVERLSRSGMVACVGNWLRLSPARGVVFFADQRACRLSLVTLMLTRRAHEELGPFRSARVGADFERYEDLRARFGLAALTRIRAPLILARWAEGSATRARGLEALEDGYRSPARRAYSEWVFDKHHPSGRVATPISEMLEAHGNLAPPAELDELG